MLRATCLAVLLGLGVLVSQPVTAQPPGKKGDSVTKLEKELAELKAKVKEVEDQIARAKKGEGRPGKFGGGFGGFGKGKGKFGKGDGPPFGKAFGKRKQSGEARELIEKFRALDAETKKQLLEQFRKEVEKPQPEKKKGPGGFGFGGFGKKKKAPGAEGSPAPGKGVEQRLEAIEKALEELRRSSKRR